MAFAITKGFHLTSGARPAPRRPQVNGAGNWLSLALEAHQASIEIRRLMELSDAQLARRGLERSDIVRAVYEQRSKV